MKSFKTRPANPCWGKSSNPPSVLFEIRFGKWIAFPYISLKRLELEEADKGDSIHIEFASGGIRIGGVHLRDLFLALQAQEVESVRLASAGKRGQFSTQDNLSVLTIRLLDLEGVELS